MLIYNFSRPQYLIPLREVSVDVHSQLEENIIRIFSTNVISQNILNYLKYSCIWFHMTQFNNVPPPHFGKAIALYW